jgi:hypothetical protein
MEYVLKAALVLKMRKNNLRNIYLRQEVVQDQENL